MKLNSGTIRPQALSEFITVLKPSRKKATIVMINQMTQMPSQIKMRIKSTPLVSAGGKAKEQHSLYLCTMFRDIHPASIANA